MGFSTINKFTKGNAQDTTVKAVNQVREIIGEIGARAVEFEESLRLHKEHLDSHKGDLAKLDARDFEQHEHLVGEVAQLRKSLREFGWTLTALKTDYDHAIPALEAKLDNLRSDIAQVAESIPPIPEPRSRKLIWWAIGALALLQLAWALK